MVEFFFWPRCFLVHNVTHCRVWVMCIVWDASWCADFVFQRIYQNSWMTITWSICLVGPDQKWMRVINCENVLTGHSYYLLLFHPDADGLFPDDPMLIFDDLGKDLFYILLPENRLLWKGGGKKGHLPEIKCYCTLRSLLKTKIWSGILFIGGVENERGTFWWALKHHVVVRLFFCSTLQNYVRLQPSQMK